MIFVHYCVFRPRVQMERKPTSEHLRRGEDSLPPGAQVQSCPGTFSHMPPKFDILYCIIARMMMELNQDHAVIVAVCSR